VPDGTKVTNEIAKRILFYRQMSSEWQIFNTKLTITMKTIIYRVKHIGVQ